MSFASDQVTRLETLLAANVGVESVTVGGRSVKYADLLKQYEYWQSKVALENGTRKRVGQIYLGNN